MRQVPEGCEVYFYRTSAGAEIDLVLFNQSNEPLAIEIKYSLSPKVTKGFWIALEDLSCKTGFVVYPGNESFSIGEGVSTLPVDQLRRIAEILS